MSLSKRQKAVLCQLARQAWDAWSGRVTYCRQILEYEDPFASDHQLFSRWRREQQKRVTGRASLTELGNADYLLLRGHWLGCLPEKSDRAMRDLLRHQEEPRLRALHLIERNCRERGLSYPAYPAAICRTQYKCRLEDATEAQLWRIMYTVRSRRRPQK